MNRLKKISETVAAVYDRRARKYFSPPAVADRRYNGLKKISFALGVLALAIVPEKIFACSACFGKSDSDMAQGMNAGIFSLLAIVGTVLLGTAAFGIYLVRRAAKFSQAAQNNEVSAQPQI